MRVRDLPIDKVTVGLRVKGLATGKIGVVVKIDADKDDFAWVQWEDMTYPHSGFYGNDSDCEVVE